MQLEQFKSEIFGHYNDFYHPTAFTQAHFDFADQHFPKGECTKYLGHLLNTAIALLEPGEVHAAFGSASARALAYALRGNYNRAHYALGLPRQELKWFEQHRYPTLRAESTDFFAMMRQRPLILKHRTIGMCFYGIIPGEENKINGLRFIEPFLADRALIVIDHANLDAIRGVTYEWIKQNPRTSLLFDLPTPVPRYPTWGNGVLVVEYRRK